MRASVEPDPDRPHAFTHSASTPVIFAPTATIVEDLKGFEPEPNAIVCVIASSISSSITNDEFDY